MTNYESKYIGQELKTDKTTEVSLTDYAIETRGLTRHFGNICAVNDLSLSVPRGSVYAFLGPNGAGKTTSIRMLLGLAHSDSGEIRIFDQLFNPTNRRLLLGRIGSIVEEPCFYPHLTGEENLRVTQELVALDRANVSRVLKIVHLERDAHRQVQTYSQGMRQRLGIALALLGGPELLILDEPTNGLDPAGIHEIRNLIREFPVEQGITVFLSSHLLAEVEQLASHVGIIGRGHLLFEGTLADLKSHKRECVIIECDRPLVASSLLSQAGWKIEHVDDKSVTVELPEQADIARATAALVNAGLNLYQIKTLQPLLEDLFLDLTSGANLSSSSAEEVNR